MIRVIDRQGLEAASCECYELVKKEFKRLAVQNTESPKVSAWNGIERRDGELTHKRDLQRLLDKQRMMTDEERKHRALAECRC